MSHPSQRLIVRKLSGVLLALCTCSVWAASIPTTQVNDAANPLAKNHSKQNQTTLNLSMSEQPDETDDPSAEDEGQIVEDVPIEQIRNFIEVFQMVKANYVADTTDTELFENAIHGLVEELDPYSRYLDAANYKQLIEFTEGQIAEPQFKAIFNQDQQNWQISELALTSDAYHKGLRNGDRIERINGINVQPLDQRALNSMLMGAQGSMLSIRIKSAKKSSVFEIIRDRKLNYDVTPFLTEDHILVLKIKAFQQDTTNEVQSILETYAQRSTIRGLMIDVRDNPGGLLSAAVDLASLFLEKGLIVTTKGRNEPAQNFQALPSTHPITYPIAILQNRYSASAAEVFSAALKEHHRAVILGETSYGKGAVQKLFPLKQGALQLTVSHYYTPNGHLIEGKGIEPNYRIEMSRKDTDQQMVSKAVSTFNQTLAQLPTVP